MASKKSESTLGGISALFSRPKTEFADKKDETISISPQPSDLVYLRQCKQCTFKLHKKAAKCIIESCSDVKLEMEDLLISGTLEMIDCKSVTVSINPQDQLPTVSVERSNNIRLNYFEPQAFGSVFTVGCSDVFVHFQPPHREEYRLDLPSDDETGQYISELKGTQMIISKVIREGSGYAVKKVEITSKQKAQLRNKVDTIVKQLATKSEPAPGPTTGTDQTTPTQVKPSSKQDDVQPVKPASAEVDQSANSPLADPSESPLAAAIQAKRNDLKPTETVERSLPVVGVEEEGPSGGSKYNIEDDDSKREYFDSAERLSKKVNQVADWVRKSRHLIVFTGAGVSTSAGIPDFRSGMDTVLKTGPGVWELMAHKSRGREGSETTPMLQALPTPTHMAIVKLHEAGIVKFTVSQNVDGLHRRSGLGPSQLAELHGNTNLETCHKCHRQYLRDFETREAYDVFDHRTSRSCDDPNCRGYLADSIINFGENLPERELTNAFEHAEKADLCIVLGSSLRVRPACLVPEEVLRDGGKVVISNLQSIPQFPPNSRTIQVFAKCDDFMSALMTKLGHEIPPFTLKRRARVTTDTRDDGSVQVTVTGLDRDEDLPYSFIQCVSTELDGQTYAVSEEPLSLTLPTTSIPALVLHFHGHYREPPLTLRPLPGAHTYCMNYNPLTREWKVKKEL